jgi:UDP-N-acetylglucosamine transferase subunit ALG13
VSAERPVVLVTVGTDHHRFDRLVRWADDWLACHPAVRGLMQIGTSTAPRWAGWVDYLGYDEMEDATRQALAVVTHGGPGSIMLSSAFGRRPIVVPRRAALGEHVDDHQVVFCRRLAAQGAIDLAESEGRLGELLSRAVATGQAGGEAPRRGHVEETVRRVQHLVEDLVAGGR